MDHTLRTSIGRAINSVWVIANEYKNYILLVVGLLAAAYFLGISFQSVKSLVVVSVLFVIGAFSTFYKRYFRAPPAFELMTFTTVVVTINYGFLAGLIYGALVQLSSEVLSGAIDAQIIIFVPARALLAAWVWFGMHVLGISSLFWLGMLAIVAYNLMVQPISFFVGDVQLKAKTIYYTIAYSLFNFFIFSVLSRYVAAIMGIPA
ncbi:hypothetical protein HYU11_03435 [Candidatus Woesearchaeota archaeon]|nr:hypothetical protein [Candidatus Woesearchaeota archaeon]